MARKHKRKQDRRNFGYGHHLAYAGKKALQARYAGGHYGTVAAHTKRWKLFCEWCKSKLGITEAHRNTVETLDEYVEYLRQRLAANTLAVSTAHNRVSSVNQVLEALRGDREVRVDSPRKTLGVARTHVRTQAPKGGDRVALVALSYALVEAGHARVTAIVGLARYGGLRLREAYMVDLPRLRREVKRYNEINVQDGTKGGRRGASAPRKVPVTPDLRAALDFASAVAGKNRNLIRPGEESVDVENEVDVARPLLKAYGLKDIHSLRSVYACERYAELTGHPAPVYGGTLHRENPALDRQARERISYELGHGRIDVVAHYIGKGD